ncbi:putative TrmH family tRNA/rRNA methyltransferase [bioreactor metagenome]|uniref:Putative TrmH family tRNA/rRNA methyltransferase n=1 Tax=bioreactor metagenome TaxID=1076179 RepID=A0A644TMP8_9ZZZZ|nr:23S rRNA (guanosine(2251)-2'-O)-methyltransferase RlmB [Negativicutes bacterium]
MAESSEIIVGRNSVSEALKSGRSINKIFIAKGQRQGSVREIIGEARDLGLMVQEVEPAKLDVLAGNNRHQGIVAMAAPISYVEVEDILAAAADEPPFVVLLDELEDPHNVGAILRTADAAGVHGVLIPKRRSCPISATVSKTSAGAVEYVPVARIGNISQTIKQLKAAGLWIVGADMDGDKDYYEADLTGPIAVIIGSEGKGMGRIIKEQCDFVVRIPMRGKINSLNASVACSLLLYEILRQRELKNR